jgi:ligand-binding sensor domain-containing protein/signal transduction histidine kinase
VNHIWQTNSQAPWSDWQQLGGKLDSALTVISTLDGRVELFGLGADSKDLVRSFQRQPGDPTVWSDWESLGGNPLSNIAVGINMDGRFEVFGVSANDGSLRRRLLTSTNDNMHWSPWLDFGTNVEPGVAVGQGADRRLEVMAVARPNHELLHRWQTLADASDQWSAWAPMGSTARSTPAIGQNEDGDLEVFTLDLEKNSQINYKRQMGRASDWLDWSTLDRVSFQYSSRTWQTDEGLPNNQVQAIAQTRDGYLWLGTLDGLARFDGATFVSYNPKNTPALKNPSVTSLCADRDSALWIGTDGGGLVRLSNGVFTRLTKADGLAGDVLRVIFQTSDGALWFGTTTGLTRYKDNSFKNYSTKNGLLSDVIRSLYEDRDRNLWIATGAGLNRLSAGSMDSFSMPNGLPNDSVRAICQDRGGRIWIGSNDGMLWYNWFWKTFFAYNTFYGISDTFVSAICEDRGGNLWVGTYSGLNRFHEGRFFNQLDSEGAPFDRVNTLFEDRQGDVWVGSRQGLVRLTPKHFTTYGKQQGLTHNNIMSVLEDHEGGLWVGTWGGGLNRLKDETVTTYATTNDISENLVLSLCEGKDGTLWVGSDFDGGLASFKDGAWTHYTWKDGLINAPLRVIHEDQSGRLWIGTSRGLSCFQNGKFVNSTSSNNLPGDAIHAICEDHAGTLWFGTDNGLTRLKDAQFTTFTSEDGLFDNTITALYEDRARNLWIGTRNGGLNLYRNGRFSACTAAHGLFSDQISEILEDNQGWLWMSCDRGVFTVRKKDLLDLADGKLSRVSSVPYDKADGIESSSCNGAAKPAGWKTHDGRLWFPTAKGLIAIDPSTTIVNPFPPPVYLEAAFADKKPVAAPNAALATPNNPASALSLGSAPSNPVSVPPGRGELEFRYTCIDLRSPEDCHFKYKLEGVDADWTDAGTRRVAYYNHINPGTYTFRVVACGRDGIWNDAGATLTLTVQPHLWQIGWLRILSALAVLGIASGSARYVTRKRLQRRLELLEHRHAVEKERGRIAKDIHDDLGSSLTRIMMLGQRAEEGLSQGHDVAAPVRKIMSTARETVQAMDEMVWAVNPENDSLEGLVEYITHYANEFFEDTHVRCRLEMPTAVPPFALTADARHDLFLVVKEAFNNLLKHSSASEATLQVSVERSILALLIEDNGQGFEQGRNNGGRKGNGLENMRHRVENLGGSLSIESKPGRGTVIKIHIPLLSQNAKRTI